MARGVPDALALGPGYLYLSELGSTEPTDLTTPWTTVDTDWKAVGYTDEGSEFGSQLSTDPVEVAEELDPVRNETTGRTMRVSFSMAEITATHLVWAFNAPLSAMSTAAGVTSLEPPDLGAEVRRMLGWESEDHEERWIYRQVFQTGEAAVPRRKGAAKAVIPVEFTLEKPATGLKAWKALLQAPGRT